ncbi:MAG: hypothetical protein HY049_12085 [Acidobacteria bacterium]|nr:hypothetical protein [Acidobacteriota bacterium]
MARRLGELLVAKGKLTTDQLQKALQAQMIWGGHLGTNLIELGYLSEDELGEVLAEAHSVRYAPYDMLQEIPAAVLSSIPRGLVEKYKIIPFRFDGKKLHLVMLTPQDLMALDEVAFATGFQLVPYVTPEIRLFQVLEKYYSIPRAKRYITLSRELSLRGLDSASTKRAQMLRPRADAPRPAPDILSAPPRASAPASPDIAPEPSDLPADDGMTAYATTAATEWSPPAAGGARAADVSHSELVPEPIDEAASREGSIDRVLRSQTLEEVCSSLIEVAAETFRRCVVFARMGEALVPVAGLSASYPVWSVEGLVLPFTLSALEALFAGGRSYYLGPPPGGAHENEFYTRMGEGIPPNAFLSPVRLSDRIALVFYGDHISDEIRPSEVEGLLAVLEQAGLALDLLGLRRKDSPA